MPDADISKRYFLVCHVKIVFNFLRELKQGIVTSLDGIKRPVDSDVTEGVITTRSNGMKFRLDWCNATTVLLQNYLL